MFIKVDEAGQLSLEEADNFSCFHVLAGTNVLANTVLGAAFHAMASEADDGHFWLDAHAVAALSGKADDTEWQLAFRQMITKAEPYGFSDVAGYRIKSHVIDPTSGF